MMVAGAMGTEKSSMSAVGRWGIAQRWHVESRSVWKAFAVQVVDARLC